MHSFGLTIRLSVLLLEGEGKGAVGAAAGQQAPAAAPETPAT